MLLETFRRAFYDLLKFIFGVFYRRFKAIGFIFNIFWVNRISLDHINAVLIHKIGFADTDAGGATCAEQFYFFIIINGHSFA